MNTAQSSPAPEYKVTPVTTEQMNENDDDVIALALSILRKRIKTRDAMHAPGEVKNYLIMRNAAEADQHIERFGVLHLDNQNRVITCETMFNGTLSQTSVYPREIVRAALRHNSAAVILTHNHPSGSPEPSRADEHLTQTIKASLALVDVRVLDHIIVSGDGQALSMAERGLM